MLLFVLLISAVFSAWLSWRYTSSLHTLQRLQPQVMQVNAFNNIFQALYNDSQEYAKRNPDLKDVMQAVGKAHLNDATKPAGK